MEGRWSTLPTRTLSVSVGPPEHQQAASVFARACVASMKRHLIQILYFSRSSFINLGLEYRLSSLTLKVDKLEDLA